MARTNVIGTHKTSVCTTKGTTCVKYHWTNVVEFEPTNDGKYLVTLNNGGWMTNTTKLRMNQTANQFGLGFSVYQKDFEWFVEITNGTHHRNAIDNVTIPFENGMEFTV